MEEVKEDVYCMASDEGKGAWIAADTTKPQVFSRY